MSDASTMYRMQPDAAPSVDKAGSGNMAEF